MFSPCPKARCAPAALPTAPVMLPPNVDLAGVTAAHAVGKGRSWNEPAAPPWSTSPSHPNPSGKPTSIPGRRGTRVKGGVPPPPSRLGAGWAPATTTQTQQTPPSTLLS